MTSTTSPASRLLRAHLRRGVLGAVLLGALLGAAPAFAEPSIDDIYQAERAGRTEQAQQMIDEVLKAHPNSAKAHYVAAEIAADHGQPAKAREELERAQQIAPNLPFANQGEVLRLQSRISTGAPAGGATSPGAGRRVADSQGPSGAAIALGLVALAFFGWLVLRFIRHAQQPRIANSYGAPMGPGYGAPYAGPGYGPQGYGPGGGLGSQVAGGLATGLAVGAGVVAAEAIGDRIFGHGGTHAGDRIANVDSGADPGPAYQPVDDFGISDSSSWDDGGSSSDSGSSGGDWDT